jgi:hypothetical protein
MPKKKSGLLLPFAGLENERLGRELLDNPAKFVKDYGLTYDSMKCPKEAHDALNRGKAFAAEIEAAKLDPSETSIAQVKKAAAKHFGRDFNAALVPFGMRFSERLKLGSGLDFTATGSGSVTFLDSDADVDD